MAAEPSSSSGTGIIRHLLADPVRDDDGLVFTLQLDRGHDEPVVLTAEYIHFPGRESCSLGSFINRARKWPLATVTPNRFVDATEQMSRYPRGSMREPIAALTRRPYRASIGEMDTLAELIDLYLLRCKVEGKSPNTVRAYRWTLERFLTTLREQGAPERVDAIERDHIYAYLGRFTHLAADTRHRYFREVRCFFNWLVESGYLEQTPFRGVKNIRLPQRIVQPFSAEEVMRLLAACVDQPVGLRNRAMVFTLLDTGLRCSEIIMLEIEDLDMDSQRLLVRFGKGNKQRVVPFAERCREAIGSYLALRGTGVGPLFVASSPRGQLKEGVALRPNGLKQMLRRLGSKTGIAKVHAHRFRHTFATWAIEHDAREIDVQYLLGHSSPDMVRRYSSSYGSEQAAQRHHRFSPGDQMLSEEPVSPQIHRRIRI